MGAIEAVVRALFERTVVRRMPLAFALACATVLQPIFIDVLIVIVAPLVRRVAARIGPGGLARMATALTVGCACGVMMVVPGVGVLALAGVLDVPLGRMLLLGLLVAVPTVALTTTIDGAVFARGWNPARDETAEAVPEPSVAAQRALPGAADRAAPTEEAAPSITGDPSTAKPAVPDDRALPLPVVLAPLLGALVLVAAGVVAAAVGHRPPVLTLVSAPPVALLDGVLGTMAVASRVLGREGLERAISQGFRQTGLILVLTAVGGSLAEVISRAGLGQALEGLSTPPRRSTASPSRWCASARAAGSTPRASAADCPGSRNR
jgi:H+/gluconate symporter-like permease